MRAHRGRAPRVLGFEWNNWLDPMLPLVAPPSTMPMPMMMMMLMTMLMTPPWTVLEAAPTVAPRGG